MKKLKLSLYQQEHTEIPAVLISFNCAHLPGTG